MNPKNEFGKNEFGIFYSETQQLELDVTKVNWIRARELIRNRFPNADPEKIIFNDRFLRTPRPDCFLVSRRELIGPEAYPDYKNRQFGFVPHHGYQTLGLLEDEVALFPDFNEENIFLGIGKTGVALCFGNPNMEVDEAKHPARIVKAVYFRPYEPYHL